MIKLYQFEDCPYCEKVRQCLKSLNLDYEKVEVPYEREKRQQIVIEKNNGKVPVLDDNGKIIVESNIIVQYLNEKYGTK